MKLLAFLTALATCIRISLAAAIHDTNLLNTLSHKRRSASWNETVFPETFPGPTVDLGYAIYQGVFNDASNLNTFKGIRYAAPPTGSFRWQLPQAPRVDRSHVVQANQLPVQCPQAFKASGLSDAARDGFISDLGPSSEDCLFLNIYAPANATEVLPVLVYIHGGGYGYGNANQDLSSIIAANENGFIGVGIQYRTGAFGFLSSNEVHQFGILNAGLRDQQFALQWVQTYIHLFGGNASRVTIAGESSGGGSVMLLSMAFDGELGQSLFSNVIAASPYLPGQYSYNDFAPSQAFYAFAEQAGCFTGMAYGNVLQRSTIFDCLVEADTTTLMKANGVVTASGIYGTWAFTPVTDGTFLQQAPSAQLLQGRVNGARILSGNNAQEGTNFVPQNLTAEADVESWLHTSFPMFSKNDVAKVLFHYPLPSITAVSDAMIVLNVHSSADDAVGQQSRANDIYSESVFVCPSYWLAEAFNSNDRQAFKYQYSVLPGLHGTDFYGYFGPPQPYLSAEFMRYFQRIWGNFIIHNDPSVNDGEGIVDANVAAIDAWPAFSTESPTQLNLNQTGGQLVTDPHAFPLVSYGKFLNSTYYVNPGLKPNFSLVNAYTFESGRGNRCDFWRAMGHVVPE